jgi:hypothetical protein
MTGRTHTRGLRGGARCLASVGTMALLATARVGVLLAQVGHDPGHSPYHDMPGGGVAVLDVGYLSGSRGKVGVGPSDGATAGLRYDLELGAIGVTLGLAYSLTTRYVVDPTAAAALRTSGPFHADAVLVDAGLHLVLTGRKTWHGLAPYVGGVIGVAANPSPPKDPSGYDFGTKLTLGPNIGLRWYPARRFSLRTDVRLMFWKLSYPASYKQPDTFDNTRVLPLTDPLTQWTAHPWVTLGVGWIF